MEADQKRKREIHGTAIKEKGILSWADLSVSRPQSLVENVFGESLILHKAHLLQDVGTRRPIFNYASDPVAAVSVSTRASRVNPEFKKDTIERLLAVTADISLQLGYNGKRKGE